MTYRLNFRRKKSSLRHVIDEHIDDGYAKDDTSENNVVWTKFARNPLGTLVGVLHLMLHNICLTQERMN